MSSGPAPNVGDLPVDQHLCTSVSSHKPSPQDVNAPKNDSNRDSETPNQGVPVDNPTAGQDSASKLEFDDFGLPIRSRPKPSRRDTESPVYDDQFHDAEENVRDAGKQAASTGANIEKEPAVEGPVDSTMSPADHREERQSSRPGLSERDTTTTDEVAASTAKKCAPEATPPEHNVEPPPVYTETPAQNDTAASRPKHALGSEIPMSQWSHQRLNEHKEKGDDELEENYEGEWKEMTALDEFDVYDDYGRLIARGSKQEDQDAVYQGLGGAGKGYTRVQLDDDEDSINSMDEDTSYLFKETAATAAGVEGEELRDTLSQLQATKDLLTESQRIAYVGVTRLTIFEMVMDMERAPSTKGTRKWKQKAIDSARGWGQAMMTRLYSHMDISTAEQVMIEQLAEHGVRPEDLVRPLMENARVKNPLAEVDGSNKSLSSTSGKLKDENRSTLSTDTNRSSESSSLPPYDREEDVPEVQTPSQLPTTEKIDIDIRWTALCDLFLVLISDSNYDSRSRTLLERVGASMEVSWLQIAKFEKRVIDALEMQEDADKETWDESEHMEKRRKSALKRKYMIMGLATVGGGLVIGLSAGLLAPVIGAGLAAGFTTIGVGGTSAFLGGAGGTALIASGATLTGSTIGLRASHRRTGAVQTFEYRPLHNNKKFNLIVTVSGWMTGNVDDVRLPYSTVDPIMGDIYSVLWEPEMLKSMGATINILATEALTQGLQQVLGSTILTALMASLQLPLILTKLSYLIDNPWNVSLARANAAGLILADSLMDRNLGKRPVTLLGYSLGARVIFSCLKELADKGAYGIVQNVYLFGSPVVANKDEYIKARGVVSGSFVNGYASNDWILGYLFRATSGGILRVAGLAPVEGIRGIENVDVTKLVNGHMDYRAAIPRLLKHVGWEVLSEEFAEIEDPDPENHAERQRELIREIDEARREAETKPEKKRFGLFKRGKLAQKKAWEKYEVDQSESPQSPTSGNAAGSVLFDIDAIRAELASEMMEVKQLESTLPPMKLNLNSPSLNSPATPSSFETEKPQDIPQSPPQPPPAASPGHTPPQRTPSPPSPPKDETYQMTFDTSYHEPPQRSLSYEAPTHSNDNTFTRPALRSSATATGVLGVGAATGAVGAFALEENAWADPDEGEISMTFE
ncbi:TMCO4 family protein [Aspergillus foveolatus]|uniref:TMCO4 family protein n=1 Tax=Aspergillus foveolatus TaxID=210207 RepID=UPI003CCD6620